MNRDERATEQLLRSWYDWVPGTKTSTGQIVARSAIAGEAATSQRRCPACHGEGRKRTRGIEQPCERCRGRGHLNVDAYTQREIAPQREVSLVESIEAELAYEHEHSAPETGTAAATRAARRAKQDSDIVRLEALFRVQAGLEATGDLLTAAIESRDRQYAAGDYMPLERRMSLLRGRDKTAHDALMVTYVWDTLEPALRKIGATLRLRAEQTLAVVAIELRADVGRTIRVPPWIRAREDELAERRRHGEWRGRAPAHERQRRERNGLVQAMAAEGRSTSEIAARSGLTERRVRQIVASSAAAPMPRGAVATFRL